MQIVCKYGGWGYGHILNNIVMLMTDYGIARGRIDHMMRANAARFLHIY